jgi:hypothetical protein
MKKCLEFYLSQVPKSGPGAPVVDGWVRKSIAIAIICKEVIEPAIENTLSR